MRRGIRTNDVKHEIWEAVTYVLFPSNLTLKEVFIFCFCFFYKYIYIHTHICLKSGLGITKYSVEPEQEREQLIDSNMKSWLSKVKTGVALTSK